MARRPRVEAVEVLVERATVGQAREGVAPGERVLTVAWIDQVLMLALQ